MITFPSYKGHKTEALRTCLSSCGMIYKLPGKLSALGDGGTHCVLLLKGATFPVVGSLWGARGAESREVKEEDGDHCPAGPGSQASYSLRQVRVLLLPSC